MPLLYLYLSWRFAKAPFIFMMIFELTPSRLDRHTPFLRNSALYLLNSIVNRKL